jgi:hypothetical protein
MLNIQTGQSTLAIFLAIILVVIFFGGGSYYLLTSQSLPFYFSEKNIEDNISNIDNINIPGNQVNQNDPFQKPVSQNQPKPNPLPVTQPSSSNVLSVIDVTGNKEFYLGKQVTVKGKAYVRVFESARPCDEDDPVCDTTMGAQLDLQQEVIIAGEENTLVIFKNGAPYPCEKTAPFTYKCGPYTSEKVVVTTITGVWSKDLVPTAYIGTSGGQPPKPIKWADRYYLDVK